MTAEFHQPKAGGNDDHPGPVIAPNTPPIRHGDDQSPVTIVVPVKRSMFIAKRTRCILQTDNHAPDIIST